MCSSTLSLIKKFFLYSKQHIVHTRSENRRQVVANTKVITNEKSLTVRPKKCSRSLTGGGRLLEVSTVRL